MIKFSAILFSLFFLFSVGCKDSDGHKFQKYEPDNYFVYGRKPAFWVDSINGKTAFVSGLIQLLDNEYSVNQAIRFEKGKIIMRLLDKPSKEFVAFDFNLEIGKQRRIEIFYGNKRCQFSCILERKVLNQSHVKVHQFRIKNFAKYHNRTFDGVLFVTAENGVIGSYLSGNEEGTAFIIGPSGELLKKYIDYSKIPVRELK